MALPLEFVIVRDPVSQQARRRDLVRQWIQQVRREAEQHWNNDDSPHDGPVMLTITYLYDRVDLDVDNIPKPIMDALKGLAYSDDGQVTDMLCRKRDIHDDLQFLDFSQIVMDAFGREERFVHILVEEAQTLEVVY